MDDSARTGSRRTDIDYSRETIWAVSAQGNDRCWQLTPTWLIFDPKRKHTIQREDSSHARRLSRCSRGIEVTGMPDLVLSRGKGLW